MTVLKVLLQNDVSKDISSWFIFLFLNNYFKGWICVEMYFYQAGEDL